MEYLILAIVIFIIIFVIIKQLQTKNLRKHICQDEIGMIVSFYVEEERLQGEVLSFDPDTELVFIKNLLVGDHHIKIGDIYLP